jgi:hypothetical protein
MAWGRDPKTGQVLELNPGETAESAGLQPLSPAEAETERQRAEHQEELTGAGGTVKAGLEAAGRALTFGGSTWVERDLGVSPQDIAAREELNPVAAGVGTAVGIIAPTILSGGVAGAGEGGALAAAKIGARASAPSLIAKAGLAAEGLAARALPTAGKGLAQTLARKAVAKGVGSAAEGALYGLGQSIHEEALGDPGFSASALMQNVGLGAALGFGAGFGLSAGGQGLKLALSKARQGLEGGISKLTGKAAEVIETKAPGEMTDWMMANRARLSEMEVLNPGTMERLQTGGSPENADWVMANIRPGANKKSITRLIDAADRVAPETAPAEMQGWVASNRQKLLDLETEDEGITAKIANMGSPETADRLLTNWDKVIRDPELRNKIFADFSDNLGNQVKTIEAVNKQFNQQVRPLEIEKLLPGAQTAEQQAGLQAWQQKIGRSVDKMRTEVDVFNQGHARQLELINEGIARDMTHVQFTKPKGAAELYQRLRGARQEIDDLVPYKKLDDLSFSERNSVKELRGLRRELNEYLRDPTVWGPQAARQSALDQAQSDYASVLKRMRGKYGLLERVEVKGGVELQPNVTKVNTFLNQTNDKRGAIRSEILKDFRDASRNLVNAIDDSQHDLTVKAVNKNDFLDLLAKHEELTKQAEDVTAITQLRNAAEKKMVYGSYGAAPVSQPGEVAAATAAQVAVPVMAPGMTRDLAGLGLITYGAARLGIPGIAPIAAGLGAAKALLSTEEGKAAAAIGRMALGAKVDVPTAIHSLVVLERAGKKVTARIDGAAKVLVRLQGSRAVQTTAEGVRRLSVRGAASSTWKVPSERQHDRRVERITALASNPEGMIAQAARATQDMQSDAPMTSSAMQGAMSRAVQYLSQQARPQGVNPFGPKRKTTVQERADFAAQWRAISKPMTILSDAKRSRLNAKAVQAVRIVHPELYQKIQQALIDRVAGLGPNPKLSYSARRSLVLLLGGTDVDRRLMQSVQKAYQAQPQSEVNPRPRAIKLSLGDRSLTASERRMT